MRIELRKQPQKYMIRCTESAYNKINKALIGLEDWEGDIKELQGGKDEYRLKLPPFRILFKYVKGEEVITVFKIKTRGDVYKKGR